MSALPPIADICSALAHVRFGPKADIEALLNRLGEGREKRGRHSQTKRFRCLEGAFRKMEAMARYRSHSKEFKRQIAQEFLAGATLYGLAKRHHLSRQLIRVWVPKYEAGAFHEDAQAADLLQEYEARFLDLAQENRTPTRIERTLIVRMAHIYQGKYKNNEIAALISAHDQEQFLTDIVPAFHHKSACYRTRAFVLAFYMIGVPISLIAEFFLISRRSVRRTIGKYRDGDVRGLLNRPSKGVKKAEDKDLKDRLFAVMHAPPIDYDINRTTWTIDLLKQVLFRDGYHVGHNTLSKMIRAEGYNFRKTREVLTSNDPNYRKKMKSITRVLRRLGPDDRFFSVDEYGPFSVKRHGGRRRVRRGEYPTIPQYQSSKGRLIVTAALELSTNQVTHFYSEKKDTGEMIALLGRLLNQYTGCRRVYFSWDAASWHSSKRFLAEVQRVNKFEYRKSNQTPMVKLAPLPARAQFLNVIESVFSGMSQSIIQNSDYESVAAAKDAIDRYFRERNTYFKKNPKRAGGKLWGNELVPSKFSESNNCKNPKWMNLAAVR